MANLINEAKRMQHLAGILNENQLNELSPELLQRAGEKAKEQGRTLQANKFSQAAQQQVYKAAQIAKDAKLEPVKPFQGKILNLYYDVKTDKGILQAVEIPFKIAQIQEDTSGALIIGLYGDNKYGVSSSPYFYFIPDKDHYAMSNNFSVADKYQIRGMDQAGAQLMWKLAKAFKPDTQVTPNTLIAGAPTPIAGKAFQPTKPQAESLDIDSVVNEALKSIKEVTPNAPADVAALGKAQSTASTVASKAKAINSINEFPGAFENWFKTLGFQPGKVSKSAVRSAVEKVLTNLGYK